MAMRVLVVSDVSKGGASVGTSRLVSALRQGTQCDVEWVTAIGESRFGETSAGSWPSFSALLRYELVRRIVRKPDAVRSAYDRLNEINILRMIRKLRPDVVCLQNLHEAMSFRLVERMPGHIPLVWTLRDMWPLTGYCCYSYECDKYCGGCSGVCPQLEKWGPVCGRPADEWLRRERFYAQNVRRMCFAAPSRWLVECALKRFKGKMKVTHIPNTLDLKVFRPLSMTRSAARSILSLPDGPRIILAGAASLSDERKGSRYLLDALAILRGRGLSDLMVVGFGARSAQDSTTDGWRLLGDIRDERLLNLIYNVADVFVLPSLSDNLPNTLLEATAAGVPCVTFDVGGCSEVVRHGQTGFVAKYKDAGDLAACIERILDMPESESRQMRDTCRQVAEREYGAQLQADRYLKLFEEVSARSDGRNDRL